MKCIYKSSSVPKSHSIMIGSLFSDMRPDKKKVRHHDSKKSEAKAKAKLGQKAAAAAKSGGNSSSSHKQDSDGAAAAAVAAAAAAAPQDQERSEFGRRNIVSNWTKYELPSSEEEYDSDENAKTGQDFNFVIQNAGMDSRIMGFPHA